MHVGIQLCAPDGWQSLDKGRAYHFLHSDKRGDRVLLVHFNCEVAKSTSKRRSAKSKDRKRINPTPCLVILRRAAFEHGLATDKITVISDQRRFPEWLNKLEGIDIERLDLDRENVKLTLRERALKRLEIIYPLVSELAKIMEHNDPNKALNEYARHCSPPQNETRIRLWFYTYLSFGRDLWVLAPSFCQAGYWNRDAQTVQKNAVQLPKRGRPSKLHGKEHGSNVDEPMRQKILSGYRLHRGLGVSMASIYSRSMTSEFGCAVTGARKGQKIYFHPEGKPYLLTFTEI